MKGIGAMNPKKKQTLFMVLLFNILFLAGGVILIFRDHQDDITLFDIPLYDSNGLYNDGSKDSEGNHVFTTDYPVSRYRFIGRTGPLKSGIYTMKVYYTTNHDYYSIRCDAGTDGNAYPVLYAEPYTFSALYHDFTYRIWVNSDIESLETIIECGKDEGNKEYEEIFETDSLFSLEKIEITRDYRTTVFYKFLKLLTLLLILDTLLYVVWNIRKIQDHFGVVCGLTCIFLVSSLSVMGNFHADGHDTMFHFARIIGLADGLLGGDFPVRVQPGWLHGYGYATSVCYGDLLLYVPAFLYLLGVPIIHAYKIYVMLINLGTLLISYFCFKKISLSRQIGVGCTALYCLSVSRILNIYLRAAVGEYSAYMFLPLILLGIYEIYQLEDSTGKKETGWLLLSLGMTGIIQTHILSTMMVCIFIALTVLILIRKMSKRVFLSFVKSVLAALCLNLGFLVPLAEYSADALKVFAPKTSYGIQRYGLSLYELFSLGATATGKVSDSVQGLKGRIPESLGIAMLIAILAAFYVLAKCQSWKPCEKKRLLFAMSLGGTAVWMSTYYFPWNRLAAVAFLRSQVASIQFPWRFLSIAIPLLTYMACLAFMKLKELAGQRSLNYLLMGICLAGALQSLYCMDLINRNAEDNTVFYDSRPNLNLSKIVSSGEYLLAGTNTALTWTDLDVDGENVEAGILNRNGLCMDLSVEAQTDAWVEVPQFAYRHYQCQDIKTQEHYPVTRGTNNKIHVDLPDNYRGTLRIDFAEPWYWRLAETVSLAGFAAVILYTRRITVLAGRTPAPKCNVRMKEK